jgi:AcrR family transcriptional regulator
MANEEIKAQNLNHALESAYALCLENGIDKVTKEMIARKSGLSVKSISRYFTSKTDCVIRVAEWLMNSIRSDIGEHFPDSVFTSGKYTGAQLLRLYMIEVKKLFLKEPRIFVLYSEFKLYIYHNCESVEQGYTLLCNCAGNRRLRLRIYQLGKEDGSMPNDLDLEVEEEYFCESFFGFLSNLAISYELHSRAETVKQIDYRIDNTVALYMGGGVSFSVRDLSGSSRHFKTVHPEVNRVLDDSL